MRRLLFGAVVALTLGAALLSKRLRYWRCEGHNPLRHILGGFRCADCGMPAADLEELGFAGGGYVAPMRRTFGRGRDEGVTRAGWVH